MPPKKNLTPEQAKPFFAKFMADEANRQCADCHTKNPQWAALPLGIYICLECSGKHRGLGVHISFVRSITMDSWSERQLSQMMVGGNANWDAWLQKYGLPKSTPIRQKYDSKVCEEYKKKVIAQIEGRTYTPPANLGGGSAAPRQAAKKSSGGGGGGNNNNNDDDDGWDDWGNGGGDVDDGFGAPTERELPADVDPSLRKYANARSLGSDAYFEGDGGGARTSSSAAGGADYFGMLGDSLSKVATQVTTATKTAATSVAKGAKTVANSETVTSGWSSALSYWDKAKESVTALNLAEKFGGGAAGASAAAAAGGGGGADDVFDKRSSSGGAKRGPRSAEEAKRLAMAAPVMVEEEVEGSGELDDDMLQEIERAKRELGMSEQSRAAASSASAPRTAATTSKRLAAPDDDDDGGAARAGDDDGDFFAGFGDDGETGKPKASATSKPTRKETDGEWSGWDVDSDDETAW